MSLRVWSVIGAAFALSACGGGDDGNNNGTSAQQGALRCAAFEVRTCPCAGLGMGTQTCSAQGDSFGPCMGCPDPSAAGSAAGQPGTAGMSSAGASGEGAMAAAGSGGRGAAGAAGSAAGAAAPADAGVDGGAESDASAEPSPAAGAVPGISCGVGLPALCELETEKCCTRDLSVDTCIPADAACTCDINGCRTMEVRCDGPEDCPDGQVCCGTLSGGAAYQSFTCAAQCQATGNQRVACHEGETECPANLVCSNSQLLTNIQVCIDPATIEQ